ncbi:VWA domain-containing protein [Jiulongibacter sp. NS-SX5]|uniref:VWA domain-containing protein n=1 Tax=Jiulongibacter sp. NS-SX5 TaxID=3463854 RepID=UPI0040599134
MALAFAIIALARPQVLHTVEEEIAKGIDIVLAIDISESMLTEDIGTNRLEVAKSVAKEFVKKRQNDRIGLVVFAGQSITLCPLTTDHEILEDYLSNINSQDISSQGTAIGNAVATSINRLRDSQGNSKVIILLSDGDNTAGNIGPETSMALAKSFGIRIYSIALGLQNALEFDTQSLSALAVNTKGSFFKVNSEAALSNVFNEIDSLERKKFENITMRDVTDYYYIYLNWAIIFILLSLIVKVSPVGNLLED